MRGREIKELGGLLHERFELEDCLDRSGWHTAHKEEDPVQA